MAVKSMADSETFCIAGVVGELEVRLHRSLAESEDSAMAKKLLVLSHPHPLYGGTMNNKVITTLEKEVQKLGFTTLAYNFRGVGRSQGEHDHTIGELQDLQAVVEWAQRELAFDELHLAGFSFGSFISLKAVGLLQPRSIVTVAPPVGIYDFTVIDFEQAAWQNLDWHLIQGGQDEVVDAQAVLNWARAQAYRPDLYWREGASHFFHGELIWLRKVVQIIYG